MTTLRALERVLVADDFTDGAAAALARAASLPLGADAELHVVHVLNSVLSDAARDRAVPDAHARLKERARAAAQAHRPAGRELPVTTHVAQGQAFVEIIRQARTVRADLVVIGRHRPRRIRDALLGSTAERVVRKGDTPVLLVARPPAGAYRNVLAAVDLGDTSLRVVELATSLVKEDASMMLVHAYEVPFESTLERSVGAAGMEDIRRARREALADAGTRLRQALKPLGREFELVLRRGEPRMVVIREALRKRADLVVLGTHARSGIAHALLGSVAEWLVRGAPCDIAITRPARFSFELP